MVRRDPGPDEPERRRQRIEHVDGESCGQQLVGGGGLRSGRVVADALTRAWWPLSAAALAVPRARAPLALAALTKSPLQLADDLAYGYGLWRGCLTHRTLDPLLPARPWRLIKRDLS